MLLAGDVGGTKTLLALFEPHAGRPSLTSSRSFATTDFQNLGDMVAAFLTAEKIDASRIAAASFGVAGPVLDGEAHLTNVGWAVKAAELRDRFRIEEVALLNDLEALAWSVPVLAASELETLQPGKPRVQGNAAVIAAGTGLGMVMLARIGDQFVPVPSEGGHADFAPRTSREVEVLQALTNWYGRVQWEDVVSGRGLVNLHRFTHKESCATLEDCPEHGDKPSAITEAALQHRCRDCVEALDLFVSVYGSAAGNLALTGLATGGLYIGGGIAPKILPAMRDGRFIEAFGAKPPMDTLLSRIPVHVILNEEAGLLGAAVHISRP